MEHPTSPAYPRARGSLSGGPPSDEQLPVCSWCNEPVAKGEGRYHFMARVYHVHCWDARTGVPERD